MADALRGRFLWHELMTPNPKSAAPGLSAEAHAEPFVSEG